MDQCEARGRKDSRNFLQRLGCEIFDTHAHIGKNEYPTRGESAADLADLMERFHYRHAVVSSIPAIYNDIVDGNARLVTQLEGFPSLFFYVTCNPNQPNLSLEEIDKYRTHRQFAGLKFHPTYSGSEISSPGSVAILGYLERGVVLVHTYSEVSIAAAAEAASKFPDINFIIGHMGGHLWRSAVDRCAPFPNLFLEPSCSYPGYDKLRYAVDQAGAERVVFGSDANLLSPSFALGMVASSELDDECKRKILWYNPKRLFQPLGEGIF